MMTMKKMMMMAYSDADDHVEEVVHLCTKVANTLIKNKANISLDLSATPLVLCLASCFLQLLLRCVSSLSR